MADAPSDSTKTPSDSTKTQSGSTGTPSSSTNAPSSSTNAPSSSTNAPSSSTNAPSGPTQTPPISTEFQKRLRRVVIHNGWDHPVYHYKVKEGIYVCDMDVNEVYFRSDDGTSLAEVKENVAKKAYDYWS